MYLLLDNYDSFTYNLYALCVKSKMNLIVKKNDEPIISIKNLKGIIISPGPSSPENSGNTLKYLEKYAGKIPIFGVCLGMQCIGYFLGFKIKKANSIMHGKVDEIKVTKKSILFNKIPAKFKSVRYHSLAVKISKDSAFVKAIAKSDSEIMSIEDEKNMLFGVQFHPESYFSEFGGKIIKNFKYFCEKLRRYKDESRKNYEKII